MSSTDAQYTGILPSIADESQSDHLTMNATDCPTFLSNPNIDLNSNLDPDRDPRELWELPSRANRSRLVVGWLVEWKQTGGRTQPIAVLCLLNE